MIRVMMMMAIKQSPKVLTEHEKKIITNIFQSCGFEMNALTDIFGIRLNDSFTNHFDDMICQIVKNDQGEWILFAWPATTDPGKYYLLNPMRESGCAILKPGQYVDAYELGLHFKQEALIQVENVSVYRVIQKNPENLKYEYDEKTVETGVFVINIHGPFGDAEEIGKKSAGCQVFMKDADRKEFIENCKWIKEKYNLKRFTYTLFSEKLLKGAKL